jgi:hypothetical protein
MWQYSTKLVKILSLIIIFISAILIAYWVIPSRDFSRKATYESGSTRVELIKLSLTDNPLFNVPDQYANRDTGKVILLLDSNLVEEVLPKPNVRKFFLVSKSEIEDTIKQNGWVYYYRLAQLKLYSSTATVGWEKVRGYFSHSLNKDIFLVDEADSRKYNQTTKGWIGRQMEMK